MSTQGQSSLTDGRARAIDLAFVVFIVCLVLGPSLRTGGFLGNPGVDVWSHVWGMDWFASSLASARIPYEVEGLRHPVGGVLWYIDLLGAVISAPFMAVDQHVLGFNLVVVVQLALASGAGLLWGRALGGSGFVASAALSSTPFLLCTWSNGVLEAGWIGLVALAGVAALRESRWTGPAMGLAFVATPYLGVAATAVASMALIHRRNGRLLVGSLVIAALIALPVVWGVASGFDDPRSMAIKPAPGPRWPTWRINGVDPRAFFTPGDFWSVSLQGDGAPPFRRTPYLGWMVLVLAAAAGWRGRAAKSWGLVVLLGCVLALGPVLFHAGDFVRWPGTDGAVWLPFGWLLTLTGVGMDHPLRFIAMALVVLAGCADSLTGRRWRWGIPLAGVVLLEALVVAPTVWPLPTSSPAMPEVYGALPDDGAAIVDLPADVGGTMQSSRYLYWHSLHGRPIPYGNKVSGQLLRVENSALKRWTARGRPGRTDRDALETLRQWGYRWVVLHRPLCGDRCGELVERVSVDLGTPDARLDGWVWEIRADD